MTQLDSIMAANSDFIKPNAFPPPSLRHNLLLAVHSSHVAADRDNKRGGIPSRKSEGPSCLDSLQPGDIDCHRAGGFHRLGASAHMSGRRQRNRFHSLLLLYHHPETKRAINGGLYGIDAPEPKYRRIQ